uniref:Uncharacterized protein n=1 Tax=Setaria italica TaxID=4555 RepID=K3YWV7_SETIT
MLKSQQGQGRYQFKKKDFNGIAANNVPTKTPVTTMNDNQWNKLVMMWSTNLTGCTTNIGNHGLVRYPQHTGSRSYIAQAHVVVWMEQIIAQAGDDQPKTVVEAMAEVVQYRIF